MEKENTELYRNCNLLQSQLNHLERENASRTTEATNNKRLKLEAEIHKLNQEKRQVRNFFYKAMSKTKTFLVRKIN